MGDVADDAASPRVVQHETKGTLGRRRSEQSPVVRSTAELDANILFGLQQVQDGLRRAPNLNVTNKPVHLTKAARRAARAKAGSK